MSIRISSLLTLGLVAGLSLQLNATTPPTIESDNRLEVIGNLCLVHAGHIQSLDVDRHEIESRTRYLRSLRYRSGPEVARVPIRDLIDEAIADADSIFAAAESIDIELLDLNLELMGMLLQEENGPPLLVLKQIKQLRTEIAGLRTDCVEICEAMAQCTETLQSIPIPSSHGGDGR